MAPTWLGAALLSGCAGWPFGTTAPLGTEAPAPIVAASPLPNAAAASDSGTATSAAPAAPAAAPAVEAPVPASPPPPAAPPPPAEPPLPPVDASTRASFDEAVRMLKAGRLPEAERAFRALAEKQPQLGGVYANLGLIHRKAGRLQESATALQRAVELSPKQASYHNQLGITWRALGRFDHARKAYETAIELDPAYAGALVNLAILNDLYLGEPARAAELYARRGTAAGGGSHDQQVARRAEEPQGRPEGGRVGAGARTGRGTGDSDPCDGHAAAQGEGMTTTTKASSEDLDEGHRLRCSEAATAAQRRAVVAARAGRGRAARLGAAGRTRTGPRRPRAHADHRQPRVAQGAVHRAVEEASARQHGRARRYRRCRGSAGADRPRRAAPAGELRRADPRRRGRRGEACCRCCPRIAAAPAPAPR
ncbi:MAG: tetratricopeptide repeat protein [Rubrivivax sp.]